MKIAAKLGIHPDVFSWSSLIISGFAGLVFAEGAMGLAGWLLVFGAFCDTLDGGDILALNPVSVPLMPWAVRWRSSGDLRNVHGIAALPEVGWIAPAAS